MNPLDLIFSTISNLTGGLVNDLTTVIVAMLSISFIVMGFGYLKDLLDDRLAQNRRSYYEGEAKKYRQSIMSMSDSAERDITRAKYRAAIRRAAE